MCASSSIGSGIACEQVAIRGRRTSGSLSSQIRQQSNDAPVLPPFRRLNEQELAARTDDELIAYMREAREAGATDAARLALQILVFGYWDIVAARVSQKLPAHAVEDVTGDVIADAIRSSF